MFFRRLHLLWFCAALLVAGCASPWAIARHPFIVSEAPPDFPRLPVHVALVRTAAMRAFPTQIGGKDPIGERLAAAAMEGMLAAARLLVAQADLYDAAAPAGYDLVCTPTNPFLEIRNDRDGLVVTLSLEVVVRDSAEAPVRGMLLTGEGRPGRRPTAPIDARPSDGGPAKTAGVMGAPIYASPLEEALNNALFYLSLDFAEKLRKRAQKTVEQRAGGQ